MMMMVKLVFMVVMMVLQLLMLPMFKVLQHVVHNYSKLIGTGKLHTSRLLLAKMVVGVMEAVVVAVLLPCP